ncbi:MAG: hypothetical protein R3F19_25995 [Verrucomicrobiales bacterium]
MRAVEERDGKVLGLIEEFLKQGIMEDGIVHDPITGSPQGGMMSPLLANIYTKPMTGYSRVWACWCSLRRRYRRDGGC